MLQSVNYRTKKKKEKKFSKQRINWILASTKPDLITKASDVHYREWNALLKAQILLCGG